MPDDEFHVYDTTLRDGAQQEGLTLSVADKLAIARQLDELGVGFIEGGWPGAIPKDTEFFPRARTELDLQHAQLAAFGATRRAGVQAADDPQVAALRESGAPVVTLVAKSHDRHVELALRTTLDENLAMVRDTVSHLRAEGRRVFLDAEHFFDGYRRTRPTRWRWSGPPPRPAPTWSCCATPTAACCPSELGDVVSEVIAAHRRPARHPLPRRHRLRGGQHAWPRSRPASPTCRARPTATASGPATRTCSAWSAGLQLKMGREVLPDGLPGRDEPGRARDRRGHQRRPEHPRSPTSGFSAFAHKAGLHASAIKVDPMLYQHIDPAVVGNDMRMLVSEMAGRASVELKGRELGYDLSGDREARRPGGRPGQGAGGPAATPSRPPTPRSSCCCATSWPAQRRRYFTVESWRVIVEQRPDGEVVSEATVKLHAKGERIIATGEGNGPVNALDTALRLALGRIYPGLAELELTDYKVRILEGEHGTDARHPGAASTSSDGTSETGPRSAWTRTSSPRPGMRWRTRSPTGCSGRATSPTRPQAWPARASLFSRPEHAAGALGRPRAPAPNRDRT